MVPDKVLEVSAQAMPDEYKIAGDAVKVYRGFYVGEKIKFARWTKRNTPE